LKNEEFENFNFRETDDNKFSSYVIGPKSPAIAGPILVPVEIIEKEVPNTHVFIWGWQAYRDVFRSTKPHVTEFCFDLRTVDFMNNPARDFVAGFATCSRHNCVDEQCDDYQRLTSKLPP